MTGYLQLVDGRVVPVRDGIVIGRVAGCDCVIDDGKASRRHARVVVDAGVVEIEDLGSSNGTLLNGKPVTRRLLRAGDQVQIGKTVITYHEGAAPGAVRAAVAAAPSALTDDNDLFGDAPTVTGVVVPPSSPPPAAAPAARVPPPPAPAPVLPAPAARPVPPSPLAPAAAPRPRVVEFADEVVEVRKAPATETKPSAATPGAPIIASGSRVLQFSKQTGSGGLLGDDLGQMGAGMRSLVYGGVLLLAVGIVYGIVLLVR